MAISAHKSALTPLKSPSFSPFFRFAAISRRPRGRRGSVFVGPGRGAPQAPGAAEGGGDGGLPHAAAAQEGDARASRDPNGSVDAVSSATGRKKLGGLMSQDFFLWDWCPNTSPKPAISVGDYPNTWCSIRDIETKPCRGGETMAGETMVGKK